MAEQSRADKIKEAIKRRIKEREEFKKRYPGKKFKPSGEGKTSDQYKEYGKAYPKED